MTIDYNNKALSMRNGIGPTAGPRFTLYVVEGAGDRNPGNIRTIRFDYNGGGQEWLNIQWIEDGQSGSRVGIRAADIAHEHKKRGAFFMGADAYKDDPNPQKREQGPAVWAEWAERRERKEDTGEFPTEWLPQKILDLRKAQKEKKQTWQAPKLAAAK